MRNENRAVESQLPKHTLGFGGYGGRIDVSRNDGRRETEESEQRFHKWGSLEYQILQRLFLEKFGLQLEHAARGFSRLDGNGQTTAIQIDHFIVLGG